MSIADDIRHRAERICDGDAGVDETVRQMLAWADRVEKLEGDLAHERENHALTTEMLIGADEAYADSCVRVEALETAVHEWNEARREFKARPLGDITKWERMCDAEARLAALDTAQEV